MMKGRERGGEGERERGRERERERERGDSEEADEGSISDFTASL